MVSGASFRKRVISGAECLTQNGYGCPPASVFSTLAFFNSTLFQKLSSSTCGPPLQGHGSVILRFMHATPSALSRNLSTNAMCSSNLSTMFRSSSFCVNQTFPFFQQTFACITHPSLPCMSVPAANQHPISNICHCNLSRSFSSQHTSHV